MKVSNCWPLFFCHELTQMSRIMDFVLASGSPRRRELFSLFGWSFRVVVADVDESLVDVPDPAVNVVETARLKAEAVWKMVPGRALIIASDTTVALDGQMLNKPANQAEAWQMLHALRGRVHQVHTGLVLVDTGSGRVITDIATIDVPMRPYSDDEIQAYIDTGDPVDKAGAYAIQHPEFKPVERLIGCFAGVMGLPLCHLVRCLRKLNITVDNSHIAAVCQRHNNFDCTIYPTILNTD